MNGTSLFQLLDKGQMSHMMEEIEEFLEEILPFLVSTNRAPLESSISQDVISCALGEAVQWAEKLKLNGKLYEVRDGT